MNRDVKKAATWLWCLGGLGAAVPVFAEGPHRIYLYKGDQIEMQVSKIEGGNIIGSVGSSLITIPLSDAAAIELETRLIPPSPGSKETLAAVHVAGGDILVGSLESFSNEKLVIGFQNQSVNLSKSLVRGIKFLGPAVNAALPALEKRFEGKEVVKLATSTIPAKIVKMTSSEMALRDQFSDQDNTLSYRDAEGRLKVDAVYFTAGMKPPAGVVDCRIKGVDGATVIQGQLLGMNESVLQIKTMFAERMALKLSSIAELWFLGGNALYLSDLSPVRVMETSPWGKEEDPWVLIWRYKNDLNCRKMPILLGGKTYKRGLGVHSKCELSFTIPEGFTSFECVLGIDDRVGVKAKDTPAFAVSDVRILVDGAVLFEKRVVGSEAPLPVNVALKGGKTMTLVADYGPPAKVKLDEKGQDVPAGKEQELPLDFGDWVNFAEARFSK